MLNFVLWGKLSPKSLEVHQTTFQLDIYCRKGLERRCPKYYKVFLSSFYMASVYLIITVTQTLSCLSLCLPLNFIVIAPHLGKKMKQTTWYYYYFNSKALKSIFHDKSIKQFLTESYSLLDQTNSIILELPKFVLDMFWRNKSVNKYFQLFSITVYLFSLSRLLLKTSPNN